MLGAPIQDEQGRTTGTDTDVGVNTDARGIETNGQGGPGTGLNTDYPSNRAGDVDWQAYRQVERPVVTRAEQPDWFDARRIDLTTGVDVQIADANPARMRIEVYVQSTDAVGIAASSPAVRATATSFPAEEGYPFLSDVTSDVWANSTADQTILVVEYFRSGMAPGFPVGLGGR